MQTKLWIGFLLIALGAGACGDDTGTVRTHKGGEGGKGGKGGKSGGTAGKAGSGMSTRDAGSDEEPGDAGTPPAKTDAAVAQPDVDPAAPVVEILEPKKLEDPNSGDVLINPIVTVRCRASMSSVSGARDVNQGSVRIYLVNQSDPTKSTAGTVTSEGDGVFSATFDLTDKPNGLVQLACEASDVGKPALKGRAMIDTFLDLGPTVELIEPGDGSPHALATPVPIRFRITNAPASLDDTQAQAKDIHLVVSGTEFAFSEDPDEKGLYTQSVDFNDRTLFPMAPTSAEIVVSANSSRAPTPATRKVRSIISIDAEGPSIVIKTPTDQKIVRGDVPFQLEITDASGVDQSTVVATIRLGSNSYMITEWAVSGKTYNGHFDTHGFDQTLSQMTINVQATDVVGNDATTASILVRLDNVPPIISLSPPPIREFTVSNAQNVCSEPFDPVGAAATNDLQKVQVESLYRAMTWDRTNEAPGQNILYVADVDEDSVQIYTQPNPAIPLLIDSDGDNVCDEIKKGFDDSNQQEPVALKLTRINRKGSAPYSKTANYTIPPVGTGFCTAPGSDSAPPTLCASSEMVRAIGRPLDVTNPPGAIFAPGATSGTTGACNGVTWDLYRITDREGWTCVAARVLDTIGNVGISRPLRVCIDNEDPNDGTPDCTPSIGEAITCTDGCTWPVDFRNDLIVRAK